MIELHDIIKVYRKREHAITAFRVNRLTLSKGEYVAVVGPSGSGKTTFLSLLGGMLSPDAGSVRLENVSLYDLSIKERAKLRRERIGFVFQTFNLLSYLSALDNVQVPLFLSGCNAAVAREKAATLLDSLGLGQRLDHKPRELSTGQQQRVALARTLSNDPAVILADEPTGNLDPGSREHILSMFDQLVRIGKTIIMVTHDPEAAKRAHRQLRLNEGEITTSGSSLKAVA
jgi:putative ABC transport system ATP-binding protein